MIELEVRLLTRQARLLKAGRTLQNHHISRRKPRRLISALGSPLFDLRGMTKCYSFNKTPQKTLKATILEMTSRFFGPWAENSAWFDEIDHGNLEKVMQ